jgi:hypothetical protein
MNRPDFRADGLQGRKTSEFLPVTGKATMHPDLDGGLEPAGRWRGQAIGSFLSRFPTISYATAAARRRNGRSARLRSGLGVRFPGRSRLKRQAQRGRA